MIRKIFIIVAAFFAAAGSAHAQEDLNRSVDVSKDYAPRVERAAKLTIQPQLGDTVTLRPSLEYSVRPRAWMGGFDVMPIRAAQMNAGSYNAQYPLYVKAGGGFPGQTLVDIYATSIRPGASGFGIYANHRAQFADLENYYDIKQSAKSTTNNFGIFGKALFGRLKRLSLSGEVGLDYDKWTNYGAFRYSVITGSATGVEGSQTQRYATPRGSVVFGNDFTDLSFINFRLGGDVYSMTDEFDNIEIGSRVFIEVGRQFGTHRIVVAAGVDTHDGWPKTTLIGESGSHEYGSRIANAGVNYRIVYEGITVGLGGQFAFENPTGDDAPDNKIWFLPQVELKYAAADEFNAYALIISDISPNSYRNAAAVNPFMFRYPRFDPQPARITYETRAGFNGTIGGLFYYNVYAGGGIVKNDMVFKTIIYNMMDGSIQNYDNRIHLDEKRKSLFAGAEFEARLGNGFTVTADGRYDKYDSDTYNAVNYLPKYTASLGVSYNHHDKWHLRAGVRVRGSYEFLTDMSDLVVQYPQFPLFTWEAPTAVDVTLGTDYYLSQRLGVFLEGANLANQKLYPLPFYRGVGINVSAGVKLRF